MNSKLKKMARTGYVAKGCVYAIVGVLTFLAAFNLGGEKAGQMQVLEFLEEQTFGSILLIMMAAGLASYAAWRFVQSVSDPDGIGSDKKAMVKRGAFFISGISYLGLAGIAFWQAITSGSGDSGNSAGEDEKSAFLATETGLIILGIVGIAIMARGIYQFTKAYKADFTQKFDSESMSDEKRRKVIENTAYFGLTARGVIFVIAGFFAIQAALNADPSETKNTAEVFSFIEDSAYGAWLLGVVAAGLIGYAVYTFMMARHRNFGE